MSKDYVIKEGGAYRISDSRVSLDSIVHAYLEGMTPESIADNFSDLTLEQVYGALAFYLANRDEIDQYLREGESKFDTLSEQLRAQNPLLYQKLADYKRRRGERSA